MSTPIISGDAKPAQIANSLNGAIRDLQSLQTVNVFKDETGTPVVILDKNGLKTTAPGGGIDVTTAGNEDFTFNSNNNVFKIVQSGTNTLPDATATTGAAGAGAADVATSVAHGLSYIPAVLAFVTSAGNYLQIPFIYGVTFSGASGGMGVVRYSVSVDATHIYFNTEIEFWAGSAQSVNAGGLPVKYYLLQETAN